MTEVRLILLMAAVLFVVLCVALVALWVGVVALWVGVVVLAAFTSGICEMADIEIDGLTSDSFPKILRLLII